MTDEGKKSFGIIRKYMSSISSFRMEGERCSRGMNIRFSGIVGIDQFSENLIEILNHSGRIRLRGQRLLITVFENSQVEISGKIEELCFVYGKN